jgi:FtsZ-interacting cell division protein ZipA
LINRDSPAFSSESIKTLETKGVTFLLDIPRTPFGERVFAQMLELAKHFARTLHASLVDDRDAEFSEASLEPVRLRIIHCQSMMAANGLPAGGALARRLFS